MFVWNWRGRGGNWRRFEGSLGGLVVAGVVAVVVGVGGVNEARGQSEQSNCTLNEALTQVPSAQRALVSLQFEACADKDWAAQKHPGFGVRAGL